jgi:hypothetical protein
MALTLSGPLLICSLPAIEFAAPRALRRALRGNASSSDHSGDIGLRFFMLLEFTLLESLFSRRYDPFSHVLSCQAIGTGSFSKSLSLLIGEDNSSSVDHRGDERPAA